MTKNFSSRFLFLSDKKKHSTISTSHASVSEDTNVFDSFCLIEHLSPITYIICLNRNTAFPGN